MEEGGGERRREIIERKLREENNVWGEMTGEMRKSRGRGGERRKVRGIDT